MPQRLDAGPDISEEDLADLRRRQGEGEIADDLDAAALLLMLEAAVTVGVTYRAALLIP